MTRARTVTALTLVTLVTLVTLLFGACSGPKKAPAKTNLNEGTEVPAECCCKSNPLTSEDGKAVWEMTNRMECSTKHGDCVADVQCKKADPTP